MKSIIKIVVVTIVILGLVLPLFALMAAETEQSQSQILEEISGLIEDLAALKDNDELSDIQKEELEIAIRKEILSKVLDFSLLEVENLKEKLEGLELDNKEQESLQNQLLEIIKGFENYHYELKDKLVNEDLFLQDLKNFAKDFSEWRKSIYEKNISLVIDFILVFSEKTALDIADKRLDKINSDLNKLEGAKLIEKQNLQGLLNASIQHLAKAHLLNKQARDLLMLSASTTLANINDEISDSTNEDGSKKPEIKTLVKEALDEIKSAYKNFLEISYKVKKQLGF